MYVDLKRTGVFPAEYQLNCTPVAPRKYQKILSFSVGFFCVLGWQTSKTLFYPTPSPPPFYSPGSVPHVVMLTRNCTRSSGNLFCE